MRKNKYNFTFDDFYRMYVLEGKTSTEISKIYGCYPGIVVQYLSKYNIPKRRGGNVKGKPLPDRVKISIDVLTDLYEIQKLSSDAIAEMFGCKNTSVLYKLRKYGIRVRQCNETKKGAPSHNKIKLDRSRIISLYNKDGASINDVARQVGVSNYVIRSRLIEYGVAIKPLTEVIKGKRDGELNPNWRPHLTQAERETRRDSNKHAKWRVKVYERDQYSCQICGDKTGHNLNAHHIESYNSNKNLRWNIDNGITLCVGCHKAFHQTYGNGNNTERQFHEFLGQNIAA